MQKSLLLSLWIASIAALDHEAHEPRNFRIQQTMLSLLPKRPITNIDPVERYILHRQSYNRQKLSCLLATSMIKSGVLMGTNSRISLKSLDEYLEPVKDSALMLDHMDRYAVSQLGCGKCTADVKKVMDSALKRFDRGNYFMPPEGYAHFVEKHKELDCGKHVIKRGFSEEELVQEILLKPKRFKGMHRIFDALSNLKELHKPLSKPHEGNDFSILSPQHRFDQFCEYPSKEFLELYPENFINDIKSRMPELKGHFPRLIANANFKCKTRAFVPFNPSINMVVIGRPLKAEHVRTTFLHELIHVYQLQMLRGCIESADPMLYNIITMSAIEHHADRLAYQKAACSRCIPIYRTTDPNTGYFLPPESLCTIKALQIADRYCKEHAPQEDIKESKSWRQWLKSWKWPY